MTNGEKFERVFGEHINNTVCFAPKEECVKYDSCEGCPYDNWIDKEYEERDKSMYVERTFDSIKEAGDYITEHGISKSDIVQITLHNLDNGVTLTFTTEAEVED